jgi:hypothetical protein
MPHRDPAPALGNYATPFGSVSATKVWKKRIVYCFRYHADHSFCKCYEQYVGINFLFAIKCKNLLFYIKYINAGSVAEPQHFVVAPDPAPGQENDAAPAPSDSDPFFMA